MCSKNKFGDIIHDCGQCWCRTSARYGVHARGTAIDSKTKQPITICTQCGTRL